MVYKERPRIYDGIIKSDQANDNTDYVGIAVEVDSHGLPFHVGLIINFKNECKLFHFDRLSTLNIF